MSYIDQDKVRLTVTKADYLSNPLYKKCRVVEKNRHSVVLELSAKGLIKLCDALVELHFEEVV